jgi:signal transduction histidine kinase
MKKKIIIAITLQVVIITSILGIISYFAVHESTNRLLMNRLALARIISNNIEIFLNNNLNRLYDLSLSYKIDLGDNNWEPEKKMLEAVYAYSPFAEGVFILDRHGNEVLSYPPHIEYFSNLTHINSINQALRLGKSVISDVYTVQPTRQKVIFMIVPVWDREGRVAGVLGGILSPSSHSINQLLYNTKVGNNSFVDIIDSNEVIVASDNPFRVLRNHEHHSELINMIKEKKSGVVESRHGYSRDNPVERSHDRYVFVPLSVAPWGVIVGQSEKEIFAPAESLKRKFILFVVIFIGTSIVFSIVMTKNIVRPLKLLTASSDKIADGDLSTPVGDLGSDEILTLSRSFDTMRQKLAESIEEVKTHNIELENRVAARTKEILESREKIEQLLKKVISSQEDERKRIARGLHDTVLQDISACLIKMDTIRLLKEPYNAGTIDDIRDITMKTIDSVYSVIRGLRPSILDDLGIEASMYWILNKYLTDKGINYHLDIESPIEKKYPPEVEITLFRIFQEAIVNIARHSNAKNVFVTIGCVKSSYISICIEDDGEGFDMQELKRPPVEDSRGMGIIGMKERAVLINGEVLIQSQPGEGTDVCIRIPLKDDGKDV